MRQPALNFILDLGTVFIFYDGKREKRTVPNSLELSDEEIQLIGDTVAAFQENRLEDKKGFCAVADLAEIKKQDYILTPGRYVGIEEETGDGEAFEEKMTRLTGELSELFARSHELEEEIRKKLGAIGYEV